jgi:hypothetical protein
MTLPKRLTIYNCALTLDGGTISLQATDEAGLGHEVVLVQHAFPRASRSPDAIPGRLYFDGDLIPMRSAAEAEVLNLLRAADIRYQSALPESGERTQLSPNALILGDDIREVLTRGPEENIRALTARVIQFVESEQYLRFADRVEQLADCTRYTVWAACDQANRNQALVRLGQADGIGLRGARDLLEQRRPLAEGVSALEVLALAERYRALGWVCGWSRRSSGGCPSSAPPGGITAFRG